MQVLTISANLECACNEWANWPSRFAAPSRCMCTRVTRERALTPFVLSMTCVVSWVNVTHPVFVIKAKNRRSCFGLTTINRIYIATPVKHRMATFFPPYILFLVTCAHLLAHILTHLVSHTYETVFNTSFKQTHLNVVTISYLSKLLAWVDNSTYVANRHTTRTPKDMSYAMFLVSQDGRVVVNFIAALWNAILHAGRLAATRKRRQTSCSSYFIAGEIHGSFVKIDEREREQWHQLVDYWSLRFQT